MLLLPPPLLPLLCASVVSGILSARMIGWLCVASAAAVFLVCRTRCCWSTCCCVCGVRMGSDGRSTGLCCLGCLGTFAFLIGGIKRLSEVGSDEVAEEELEGEGPWGGLLPSRVEKGDSQRGPPNGVPLFGSPADGALSEEDDLPPGTPTEGAPFKAFETQIIPVCKRETHNSGRLTAKQAIEKGKPLSPSICIVTNQCLHKQQRGVRSLKAPKLTQHYKHTTKKRHRREANETFTQLLQSTAAEADRCKIAHSVERKKPPSSKRGAHCYCSFIDAPAKCR